ncbi:hypothetical protein ACIP2X_35605 [Streptomyces sp. NPDC089424]|uniref:hypothetical protein n=1 Tax=Streptomyces sp. NPDC089424 TaxID=3365917 RepID=UPI0038095063
MHEVRQLADDHRSRECVPLCGRICAKCVDRLHRELRTLLELYEESDQALTRATPHLRERVSGSRSTVGIVLDDNAVALRAQVGDVLAQWARLVVDERRDRAPRLREPRPAGLVRFLRQQLPWLAGHPAAVDFDEEVAELLAALGKLFGPGQVRRFPLGSCLEPGCDGSLHGVMSQGGGRVPSHVTCDAGHALPPHLWMRVADRLKDEAA